MHPSGTKKKVTLSRIFFNFKSLFVINLGILIFLLVTSGSRETMSAIQVDKPESDLINFPGRACEKLWSADHSGHHQSWSFNSGNPAKRSHFRELFEQRGLSLDGFQKVDVREIDASHEQVVIHKASSMDRDWVLVEDSALDIEGIPDAGVNIKWKLNRLPELVGRKATYSVKIAYKVDGVVYVYSGSVDGVLVEPRGPFKKGAEFDPYFQPVGSTKTLAEGVDDSQCPRDIAIRKVKTGNVDLCTGLLTEWRGPWQEG